MSANRQVYDSRHLQADCQEPGSAPDRTLGNRVWVTFLLSSKCVRLNMTLADAVIDMPSMIGDVS